MPGLRIVPAETVAQREAARAAAPVRADRRLYLTADRARVVEHGDPRAAFLLAGPGDGLLSGEVAQYGLTVVDGRVVLPDPSP